MTIDEKLRHFMDVTTQKVNEENARQLEEYEKGLEKVYKDYEETARRKSELSLKLKEESLRKQKNAELARQQMEIREQTGKLLQELDGKLYSEVKGKLERYMATGAYEKYLIEQVRSIVKLADGDDVVIYIDPEDEGHRAALSAAANVAVNVSQYSFGGGVRAVIEKKGILVDESFDTKLKEAFAGKEASLRWKTA
ncbi:MAG: hypothetical protein Q4C65_11745 [Eubacteriales bacterium]|nr:hypothetical protein [Eubacteriales bacterium]